MFRSGSAVRIGLDFLRALKPEKVVRRCVGILCRPEDFVLVVLEGADPGAYVCSVLLRVMWDAPLGRKEHRGQLSAEFLFGVVRVTESVALVQCLTVQASGMSGPVRQLVESGSVVV